MREIKFRAWDGEKILPHDDIYIYNGNPCYKNEYDHIGIQNGILMQFTGLHDKSSKEIYEGDIVRGLTTKFRYRKQELATWVIEFISDALILCMNRLPRSQYPGNQDNQIFKPSATENTKVIGNIYENPELIEAKP